MSHLSRCANTPPVVESPARARDILPPSWGGTIGHRVKRLCETNGGLLRNRCRNQKHHNKVLCSCHKAMSAVTITSKRNTGRPTDRPIGLTTSLQTQTHPPKKHTPTLMNTKTCQLKHTTTSTTGYLNILKHSK